jgi:hypothetical protein
MANLNQKGVKIRYSFERETSQGLLKSALYFTPSEFEKLTDEEVETSASFQASEWEKGLIKAKEEDAIEYTQEELIKLKQELEAQITELQTQKIEVESILNAK